MGGFDHTAQHGEQEQEHLPTSERNARYGMVLFVAYLALYGAFVLLNAFASHLMNNVVWQGVNVAILYGFGLIVAAILLSLVYGWLCRDPADDPPAAAAKR